MKRYIFFIIILICFVFLSSCRDNTIKNISTEIELDEENGGGTGILANNSAVDFYFYYPENFFIQRNDAMIVVYINDDTVQQTEKDEPVMTKTNLSATVFGLQSDTFETVEEFWNGFALPSYKEMFQDIEVLSEEDLTVDEMPAKKYTYTASLSGMKFKFSQVVFFRKQKVYSLLYTATENKYDNNINVLKTAAETFKFK